LEVIMKLLLNGLGFLLCVGAGSAAFAAPGEDPLPLTGPVGHPTMLTPPPPASGQIDGNPEMPAWIKAKVARYEAKAFSATADDGSIYTDNTVVATSQAQGFTKTCVQEVGSVTSSLGPQGSAKTSTGSQQQIVVLRGDLVNICR
jgi:hypothetical protein